MNIALRPLDAGPVAVRYPEGVTHGFLVLRSARGDPLASGELLQIPRGDRVESRLVFRFGDGSVSEESVVFSQRDVFRFLTYRLAQRGPAFPQPVEARLEGETGRSVVRFRARPDAKEEVLEGRIDLPPDVYNGMIGTLLKNLAPDGSASGHIVAFTPRPRIVKVQVAPVGRDRFFIGDLPRTATRYRIDLEVGGLVGIVAWIIGKEPPDLTYWIADGEVPAFVRFQGPFYADGPVWRVELTDPRWPR